MPRVHFDNLKLNQAIVEVRYPKGYLYWDVCGHCIREINQRSGNKIDLRELQAGASVLKFTEEKGLEARFGVRNMFVTGTRLRNVNALKEYGPLIYDVLREQIQFEQVSRVGFRVFFVLEKESEDDAVAFVDSLKLYSVQADRFARFGDTIHAPEATITLSTGRERTRISIKPASRGDIDDPNAEFDEFAPRHAVLTDVDFSVEDVAAKDLQLEEFIYRSFGKVKDNISTLLNP